MEIKMLSASKEQRVVVFDEGESVIFAISTHGSVIKTAMSKNYSDLFRFRKNKREEHKTAAKRLLLPKVDKKKGSVDKCDNPIPEPSSEELRDYRRWDYEEFPVDAQGKYQGYSLEEILVLFGKRWVHMHRTGEKPNYPMVLNQILDELGFGKNRFKIFSGISKAFWRQRKKRAAAIKQKKIAEAEIAERGHMLPLEAT